MSTLTFFAKNAKTPKTAKKCTKKTAKKAQKNELFENASYQMGYKHWCRCIIGN
jgi:5-keto 4-deoxyuronate isomerase